MELLPNVLISIPGIGPVYSAGIMAEIGDINRFDNQASLAKYAGLAWKQHQSGGFEAEVTRLIPSGNRFLKYYLCEAAYTELLNVVISERSEPLTVYIPTSREFS